MQKTKIVLKDIKSIRNFVNVVTMLDYDVDLEQRRYVVDAKSIMGIFALDTLSPITLVAHTDSADAFGCIRTESALHGAHALTSFFFYGRAPCISADLSLYTVYEYGEIL